MLLYGFGNSQRLQNQLKPSYVTERLLSLINVNIFFHQNAFLMIAVLLYVDIKPLNILTPYCFGSFYPLWPRSPSDYAHTASLTAQSFAYLALHFIL